MVKSNGLNSAYVCEKVIKQIKCLENNLHLGEISQSKLQFSIIKMIILAIVGSLTGPLHLIVLTLMITSTWT